MKVIGLVTIVIASLFSPSQGWPQTKIDQSTSGNCSPAISGTSGNVTVLCSQNRTGPDDVVFALRHAIYYKLSLGMAQSDYLAPIFRNYVRYPTVENWKALRQVISLIQTRLSKAIEAAIELDASVASQIEPTTLAFYKPRDPGRDFRVDHGVLYDRVLFLSSLPEEPPSAESAKAMAEQFDDLRHRLVNETARLTAYFEKRNITPPER